MFSYSLKKPTNIAIRFPNWLGDAVMATPILADIHRHWPEAKITAFCQGFVGSLLEENPYTEEILRFNRSKSWFYSSAYTDLISTIQQNQYDLGILLTNSFSSALLFWQGNVQNRIGYSTWPRRLLLDLPVPYPQNITTQHLVTTYKKLLQPLGISLSSTKPALYLTVEEKKEAAKLLQAKGIYSDDVIIGINPGAAYGSAKCWPAENFKKLSIQLVAYHSKIKVVIFGDKTSSSLTEKICQGLSNPVINLTGQTSLRQLMACISQCHLFLTNDSGPMHIASALSRPVIALFGSTNSVVTGPYNGGIVVNKHVACSPCHRRECPIDFRCMQQISVQEVYSLIIKQLFNNRLVSN